MKDTFGTTIHERLALKRIGMEPDILSASFRVGMRDMGYELIPEPERDFTRVRFAGYGNDFDRYFRIHEQAVLQVDITFRSYYRLSYLRRLDNGKYAQQRRSFEVSCLDELYQYVQRINAEEGLL